MSKSGLTLIDKAALMCASDADLARKLGTSPAALSQMRNGSREISPDTAALLADIAHVDAREAVIQAVIARNKTGPKAEQIRAILGKALAGGVAATWLFSYAAPLAGALKNAAFQLTGMHIVLSIVLALGFMLGRLQTPRVRVPQACLSVKGKGFAAVLTRSILTALRFAPVRCGFRAAP